VAEQQRFEHGFGHRRAHGESLAAQRLDLGHDRVCSLFVAEIGQRHIGPAPRERYSACPADPGLPAGHDGRLK
jgi:hypothetical protein